MSSRSQNSSIFISLFIATAATMLGIGIIEPIMPLYAKSMGASGVMLGLIFSGFAFSRAVFAPFIGKLSDKRGRKTFLLVGIGLFILFSILYVLADTPFSLVSIRAAQGLASVMVTPVTQAYIGDITPKGKEGSYMNLFFISFFGGTAIGPILGGILSDHFSLEAPFYAMAIAATIAFFLVLFLVPDTQSKTEKKGKERIAFFKGFKAVIKDNKMRAVLIYLWARGFYRWGFNSFFPVFAIQFVDLSKTQIGIALSGYMLAGAALQYPSGIFSDKYPQYKGHFILIGGLLSALCMFLIPSLSNLYTIIALMLIMGMTSAVARASTFAIRTEQGRIHGMGTVTGSSTTSISFGQVVGPILFGLVVDFFNIPDAFYLGGIVGLLGSFFAFYFMKKVKEEKYNPAY